MGEKRKARPHARPNETTREVTKSAMWPSKKNLKSKKESTSFFFPWGGKPYRLVLLSFKPFPPTLFNEARENPLPERTVRDNFLTVEGEVIMMDTCERPFGFCYVSLHVRMSI